MSYNRRDYAGIFGGGPLFGPPLSALSAPAPRAPIPSKGR